MAQTMRNLRCQQPGDIVDHEAEFCYTQGCNIKTNNWIFCQGRNCNRRIHMECTGLPTKKTPTDKFSELEIKLKFYCKKCDDLISATALIDEKLLELKHFISKLSNKVSCHEQSIKSTTEYVDGLAINLDSSTLASKETGDKIDTNLVKLIRKIDHMQTTIDSDKKSLETLLRKMINPIPVPKADEELIDKIDSIQADITLINSSINRLTNLENKISDLEDQIMDKPKENQCCKGAKDKAKEAVAHVSLTLNSASTSSCSSLPETLAFTEGGRRLINEGSNKDLDDDKLPDGSPSTAPFDFVDLTSSVLEPESLSSRQRKISLTDNLKELISTCKKPAKRNNKRKAKVIKNIDSLDCSITSLHRFESHTVPGKYVRPRAKTFINPSGAWLIDREDLSAKREDKDNKKQNKYKRNVNRSRKNNITSGKRKGKNSTRKRRNRSRNSSKADVKPIIHPASVPKRSSDPEHSWLFISGLSNNTTPEQLRHFVSHKTGCDDIHCFMLLRRDIQPSSRRQLSFKMRVPSTTKSTVMQRSFWPNGITVRPFQSNEDFHLKRQRQPSQPNQPIYPHQQQQPRVDQISLTTPNTIQPYPFRTLHPQFHPMVHMMPRLAQHIQASH